jgi:hypothetical protein
MTPSHDPSTEPHERFLLGDLTAEERDRFEHRLLEDPDLFEQVEAAEDDLVDRYVRGEMEAAELRRFEERLLVSDRIRQRARTARSLHRITAGNETTNGPVATGRTEGVRIGRLLPLGSRNGGPGHRSTSSSQWLAWAACLVSLVAAGVLALTGLHLQDRVDRVEQAHRSMVERALSAEQQAEEMSVALDRAQTHEAEAETLRERLAERENRISALEELIRNSVRSSSAADDPTQESDSKSVSRTTLFLALTTRAEEQPVLKLPTEGDGVDLQLGLDRLQVNDELTVTVRRWWEGRRQVLIWRKGDVEPVFVGPEGMVPITLPAECLLPGVYEIEITRLDGSEEIRVASYDLIVEP